MAAAPRTRIMIADDSAVMRSLLRSVVSRDPGLEVAGTAADGESALSAIEILHPDLILLDVEMPVMDGLATLRKLRARGHKMPVIMCSSLTQRGAKVTIDALACGASDYVAKPTGQSGREESCRALSLELIPKIQTLTRQPQAPPTTVHPSALRPPHISPLAPPKAQPVSSTPVALAIGVSTGGPAALDILLPALPVTFPLPVLIVQHMPELFTRLFAERLNSRCPLPVREAAEGDPVRPGTIYIAKETGTWRCSLAHAPALRLRCTSVRDRWKTTAARPSMCSFAPRLPRTAQARWPWCSLAWDRTDCWAAVKFANTAAVFWPRTRPPARCGECPAWSAMRD